MTQLAQRHRRYRYPAMMFAVLLLLVVGGAVFVGIRQFASDVRWVSHTHATIEHVALLYSRVKDVESAQRGYVLTGQADYLAQLHVAAPEVARRAREIVDLVADNASQKTHAERLRQLTAERVAISEQVLALYQTEGFERAQQEIRSSRGKDVMDQIAVLVGTMQDEERRLLAERELTSGASAARLQWAAVAGIGCSLILIGVVFALMQRENRVRRETELIAAASRLELAGSVQELQLAGDRLRELQHSASMLQSCRSTDEAMEIARRSFARLLPEAAGSIYLTRASQNLTEQRAAWGEAPASSSAVMAPNDCWAVRRGQTYSISDHRHGTLCAHVHPKADAASFSTCCIPLVARGETFGLVHLSGAGEAAIAHAQLVLASTEQLSLALSNLQLQETLRVQSIRDPLTGLYNRRYLEESLERELARCARRGQPLAVLMLDLDHFKRFNDTHGHDGGDALLAQFGRLLDESCRGEDIACRYGGEEFILILPEADVEAARARGEQIRSAVASLQVTHLRRSLGAVSCSIGVAVFPQHANNSDLLVQTADAALYRAKAAGRDRVEVG